MTLTEASTRPDQRVFLDRDEKQFRRDRRAGVLDATAIVAPSFWKRFLPRSSAPPRHVASQHARTSLLRYLFPNVTARASDRLDKFRHDHFPRLKYRAQSSIYRYLVARQLRKQQRKATGLLARLRSHRAARRRLCSAKDASVVQRPNSMAHTPAGSSYADLSGFRSEGREPGARRNKLRGYLKAANEIRQSYFAGGDSQVGKDGDELHDSAFPDAAIVRSGNEEMILFPSYARRHVKSKPQPVSEDYGNDEDYWRREWESHENDKAIVDVDIRGWLYTPHRGPMTRRHRLYIGVARQIIGLPAPPASKSSDSSADPSRESSPARPHGHEEDLINLEAEHLVEHGNEEAKKAQQGAHHELSNNKGAGNRSLYSANSRSSSPERGRYQNSSSRLSQMSTASQDDLSITPLQKRSSWQLPAKMSSAELSVANGHLLTRLKPFLSNPLAESPISAFFYNDSVSRQRTVYTDSSGHFTCRAPLDFVPTHVRILAGEGLSATEEVNITPERGVSMISDIDDTIKHSGITAGARDIFRNAFIRELGDLTVDGVREWYNAMADMGVKLHYVSNSPWQMYPVLASYFKIAHLPKGSFHLKQYSGALQGIFEPVAERKKSTLNKLMHDFPNRKFILVGDSGEADLEVYTDVVLDNPGRILGVFIRDVTTKPPQTGYFDSSSGPPSGGKPSSRNHSRNQSGDSLAMSKRLSRPDDIREDDQDLKAAIAASLQDMEEETRRARRSINPDTPAYSQFFNDSRKDRPPLPARIATSPGSSTNHHTGSPEEDLIDFSEPVPSKPWLRPSPSGSNLAARRASNLAEPHKHTPSPPPKPQSLRTPSDSKSAPTQSESSKPAPPRPRKPSSTVKPPSPQPLHQPHPANPSPLSQVTRQDSTAKARPPLPARPETTGHRSLAHPKHGTNSIQSPGYWQSDQRTPTTSQPSAQLHDKAGPTPSSKLGAPPALPPPRRKGSAQSLTPSTRTLPNAASHPINSNYPPNPPARSAGTWTEDGALAASPGDGLSKKEALWNQRWSRAKGILERQGVTVRSWRVGGDVRDVCGKLVEFGRREVEKEGREAEARKRREGKEGAQ